MHLYEALAAKVDEWRKQDYEAPDFPVIAEILDWCKSPEGGTFRLRDAQVRALETYWYLRLVEHTPRIIDLYHRHFPQKRDLLDALGIPAPAFEEVDFDMEALWRHVRENNGFVKQFRLEAVRESLALSYPSYILALAMGAGKTALIGAIIATEFAMAIEYPDAEFVENALVFAPGKTIIESLRQLTDIPYECILPPRLYKQFAASVKVTFTRDGDPNISVIPGSSFNLVVTNTEKIRIQKETIRKSEMGRLFTPEKEDEARQEIANRRLQAIASLPHLAIFSDEAHHTYGQALDTELKKVRKTVDYLSEKTNVICVVNTTGTPYYQRQPLRDVVIWYGLAQGIRDGILKEVAGNIHGFSFNDNVELYLSHVVGDFFKDYGDVALPDGTPAKLAIYFPQTDDVEALRPVIEMKLAEIGLPATLVLEHHTRHESKAAFDRFRQSAEHRIALLVDRGVEGWDVPALFACALARRLKTSNNFVLQAASRCLRQIPGNTRSARIYLSLDNQSILDRQLQETYGESIAELNRSENNSRRATIRLRKLKIPPLVVKQVIRRTVRVDAPDVPLALTMPRDVDDSAMTRKIYTVREQKATYGVMARVGEALEITGIPTTLDAYSAALELASNYHLDLWTVYDELRRVYAEAGEVPKSHMPLLGEQIEAQTCHYEEETETIERALALIRLDESTGEPIGWNKGVEGGEVVYTAEISYPVDREKLLVTWESWRDKAGGFGFHYSPYNFDSNPEMSFFEQLLQQLKLCPDEIEDVYFTGALTDPNKTDFRVEYKGEDDKWHSYTPDFVIRRKDGKCFIVEIKREHDREHPVDGEHGRKAVAARALVGLSPERLKYEMIFARADAVSHDQTASVRSFIEEE